MSEHRHDAEGIRDHLVGAHGQPQDVIDRWPVVPLAGLHAKLHEYGDDLAGLIEYLDDEQRQNSNYDANDGTEGSK
jgi:hypothetical protein